jgi:acetyltransferase-like isoleucine patch superfamily enzyme
MAKILLSYFSEYWDGIVLDDNVFVGPNVTLYNDRYPKSCNKDWKLEGIRVEKGVSIGINATILPGIIIGEGAVIGAGSVVTRNVPPFVKVMGNPARIRE